MRVSLIVAASANNVIGVRGELPWRLPADLRRFKQVTTGKPIVMGRDIVASPDEAIDMAGDVDELMIIGGGQLYREFLPRAQRIYLTRVAVNIAGDASFPELEAREWSETSREPHPADEEHAYSFEIIQLERIEPQ